MQSTHTNRRQQLESELTHIVKTLREKYEPEKIIAFGSFIRGTTHIWSDLDLAIIKETDKQFVDRLIEVARLLGAGIAVDVLVYTPDEFSQMQKTNYFVKDEIVGKGKVIYDKNKAQ